MSLSRSAAGLLAAAGLGVLPLLPACATDSSVESDVERLFKTVDEQFGHIDGLVNNAATLDRQARLTDMTAVPATRPCCRALPA